MARWLSKAPESLLCSLPPETPLGQAWPREEQGVKPPHPDLSSALHLSHQRNGADGGSVLLSPSERNHI